MGTRSSMLKSLLSMASSWPWTQSPPASLREVKGLQRSLLQQGRRRSPQPVKMRRRFIRSLFWKLEWGKMRTLILTASAGRK